MLRRYPIFQALLSYTVSHAALQQLFLQRQNRITLKSVNIAYYNSGYMVARQRSRRNSRTSFSTTRILSERSFLCRTIQVVIKPIRLDIKKSFWDYEPCQPMRSLSVVRTMLRPPPGPCKAPRGGMRDIFRRESVCQSGQSRSCPACPCPLR